MIYIAVQLIQIFSAGPRGSEVVREVLADLKSVNDGVALLMDPLVGSLASVRALH